ncbi:Clp protease ClpB [Mechercharimyces sp. CAU 1602]|uniref:phage scaffolding protein n=1 Tax=Mechercharimyces sp. CAU 1602 TaxID=2973933 RepID=UPI0021624420|nr:Clp protease ClpB [Mechercharimyces sp. CAU 1602]MCS1350315.1 Clp protease ClpB [Mechercharimyces sp. CAU 1602]
MTKKRKLPMNLQMFAEPTGDPTETPAGAPNTEDPPSEPKKQEEKTIPYDRFKEVNDSLKEFKSVFKELGIDDVGKLKGILGEHDQLSKEKQKLEREKLSEQERLQKDLDEAQKAKEQFEKELEGLRQSNRKQRIQNEFIKAAQANNIQYIDDAYKLADLSNVELGDDGVSGVDDVIKSLIENKPYLVGEKKQPKEIGSPSNPPSNGDAKTLQAQLDEAQKKGDFSKVIEISNKIKGLLK